MPPPMPMPPTGIPAPAIMEEGGNVAKRLVIDRDAQTEMEAEVESFVKERREKRSEIRERIQRRRRMELAERRAAKVRMWTELEDGEDLGCGGKRESLKTRERPFSGRGYAHTTVMKNDDDDTTKKVNALLANVCAF